MTYSNHRKKEEFFHVLNLVATKNVKVKYCRTIKERLRPKTLEESLALPSKSKSPTKRKPEDLKLCTSSPADANTPNDLLKGGLCYIQSYKNKKKAKIKISPNVSPPSSKSLLSYLHHHKTIDTDSSCPESDSNDHPSVDSLRKKTQISNGFSDDSIIQSKIQNKNLKDLIDGLENEDGKPEDVGGAAANLEVVEAKDVVMRMVEDFSLLSESETDEEGKPEQEDVSNASVPVTKPVLSKSSLVQIDDRDASSASLSSEDLLLREMLARYEKLDEGKEENKFLEKMSNPGLCNLVARVRRENKIFRLNKSQSTLKKRREKGKILSRCNYAPDNSILSKPQPYSCKILSEEIRPFSRLSKPSPEDMKLARKMNKIPDLFNITEICQNQTESRLEQQDIVGSSEEATMTEDSSVENMVISSQCLETDEQEDQMEVELEENEKNFDMNKHGGNVTKDEQLSKFQCSKCSKDFSTKNGLDYHERIHTGVSPYQCDVCNKKFKSSSLCSRHKQIHSASKKYLCNVCNKSFAQKSNLSKHMDIHEGVRPYSCSECTKSFTQKVHLDCHIMTHSKEKPWECNKCGNKFSKKSSLVRHVQSLHEILEERVAVEEPQIQETENVGDDQFDVEVAYCDNIQMLDVNNQTLFIIDSYQAGDTELDTSVEDKDEVPALELVPTATATVVTEDVVPFDKIENAEKIEDIQKFLQDSESNITEDEKSTSLDKTTKNEKSSFKFNKESALKIISQSSFFVKNNIKNDLKSQKVHSFEEALNAAITPKRKVIKNQQVSKKTIVRKAIVIPSKEELSKFSPLASKSSDIRKKSPVKSSANSEYVCGKSKSIDVVSKIMAEQTKSFNSGNEKKPVIKPLFCPSNKSSAGPTTSIQLEKSSNKPEENSTRTLKPPTYEDIYNSLKSTIFSSGSQSKPATLTKSVSLPNYKPVSHSVKTSSLSPVKTVVTKEEFPKDHSTHPPVSPVKTSDLKLNLHSPVKVSTSSHSSYLASSVSQGYYTSGAKTSPAKDWSRYETKPEPTPTLLPTVFPTFDSPSSSPRSFSNMSTLAGISSIIQTGSKPTAVVPPSSRPKLKMPVLPKPVPAAIGCVSLAHCDESKVSTAKSFLCNRCGENFFSQTQLVSHQQAKHYF